METKEIFKKVINSANEYDYNPTIYEGIVTEINLYLIYNKEE